MCSEVGPTTDQRKGRRAGPSEAVLTGGGQGAVASLVHLEIQRTRSGCNALAKSCFIFFITQPLQANFAFLLLCSWHMTSHHSFLTQ